MRGSTHYYCCNLCPYEPPQSSGEIPDCEALSPVLAEVDFNGWGIDENKISLSDKQKISYHKYGFRKKLVVKNLRF